MRRQTINGRGFSKPASWQQLSPVVAERIRVMKGYKKIVIIMVLAVSVAFPVSCNNKENRTDYDVSGYNRYKFSETEEIGETTLSE